MIQWNDLECTGCVCVVMHSGLHLGLALVQYLFNKNT